MQGRVYTVVIDGVAISAAQDLLELTPADDKPIELIGYVLGQVSDVGDAQDENRQIKIIRGNTTSGSGGTAPTPQPILPGSAAAGFTAETNNTTVASAGTAVTLHAEVFNVRAGCVQWFPEGARPSASQANTSLRVTMDVTADAITFSGTFYVRELI
jgi:hypothetical protein